MRTVIAILYAAILAAVFALIVSLIPTPFQPYPIQGCEGQEKTYRPEEGQSVPLIIIGESLCFIHKYRDDLSAGSTIIIAIFTIILGSFTISLARSTRIAADAARESAETGRRELELSQRAHIKVETPDFAPLSAGSKIAIKAKITNVGTTPAHITFSANNIFINDHVPEDTIVEGTPDQYMTIGPGGEFTMSMHSDFVLGNNDIIDINADIRQI